MPTQSSALLSEQPSHCISQLKPPIKLPIREDFELSIFEFFLTMLGNQTTLTFNWLQLRDCRLAYTRMLLSNE